MRNKSKQHAEAIRQINQSHTDTDKHTDRKADRQTNLSVDVCVDVCLRAVLG